MLIRFQVSNFRSILSEQGLSMVASSLAGAPGRVVHAEEQGIALLRVAAIYGANAAGKSNVLAALQFLRSAALNSHRTWQPDGPIPQEPFLLQMASRKSPSRFEIEFLLGPVRYRYGFKLDAKVVLEEWLYAYPTGRRQRWFYRNAQRAEPYEFGKSLRGSNRTIATLARKNSLFLSAAAENNHPMLSPIYSWLVDMLRFSSVEDQGVRLFQTLTMIENKKNAVLEIIRLADLGISDLNLTKLEVNPELLGDLKPLYDWAKTRIDPELFSKLQEISFVHRAGLDQDGVLLPFDRESRGTQAWLALAGPLLNSLDTGAVLCVDELDASLHSRLALEVIRIFDDPQRNSKNAQLIFNTHNTTLLGNLLGSQGLRRDQVWFVEKDSGGATHLYPLTDFKPRKDENLERGYLQGRYGATPFIASAPQAEADDG
jgi:hypothetical protein